MLRCLYTTVAGADRLHVYHMDPAGGLTLAQALDVPGRPSPLTLDPTRAWAYVGLRGSNQIASCRVDPASGMLAEVSRIDLDADPCYVATDRTGRWLLASYYAAGKVTVHPIGADGVVHGPAVAEVHTAEHAHCIQTDASNRFAFTPHTAPPNRIAQFRFDPARGALTSNTPNWVIPEPGVGPRHYVHHPSLDVVYVSNEQGSSVGVYDFDPEGGTLTRRATHSTLPAGYTGPNTCAQIHIHPTGSHLYVSNRGHDSIAIFAVEGEGNRGNLRAVGHQPTEPIPRVFNLDPSGAFLYAAGRDSGRLAAYRIDPGSGALAPLAVYAVGPGLMWVEVVEL